MSRILLNLYRAIKSYYEDVLDYSRLPEAAVGERRLLRATFYIVEKQEADEAQGARSLVYNLNEFGALRDVCDSHTGLADITGLLRRPSKQAVSHQRSAISVQPSAVSHQLSRP